MAFSSTATQISPYPYTPVITSELLHNKDEKKVRLHIITISLTNKSDSKLSFIHVMAVTLLRWEGAGEGLVEDAPAVWPGVGGDIILARLDALGLGVEGAFPAPDSAEVAAAVDWLLNWVGVVWEMLMIRQHGSRDHMLVLYPSDIVRISWNG